MKIVGHDFLVGFADGIDLEITGPRRQNQKLTRDTRARLLSTTGSDWPESGGHRFIASTASR